MYPWRWPLASSDAIARSAAYCLVKPPKSSSIALRGRTIRLLFQLTCDQPINGKRAVTAVRSGRRAVLKFQARRSTPEVTSKRPSLRVCR